MIFVSFIAMPFVYSDNNDNRYHDDSSSVFAPGYLNAAKYQAEAIMNQQTPTKSLLDNIVDYVIGKTSDKADIAAKEKSVNAPILQKKMGNVNRPQGQATIISTDGNSLPPNVAIGHGSDQRDVDGNLVSDTGKTMMSEVFDGVRYNYAGFTGVAGDTIQAAIDRAGAGETVLVRTSAASGNLYGKFSITKAINVYGGYSDDGNFVRATNILASMTLGDSYGILVNGVNGPVEIGGFNVTVMMTPRQEPWSHLMITMMQIGHGAIIANNSQYVNIIDCTLTGAQGLLARYSTVSVSDTTLNGAIDAIGAFYSTITAESSGANGFGAWSSGAIGGSPMSAYNGGGYGVFGYESNFSFIDTPITSYLDDTSFTNSQATYTTAPPAQTNTSTLLTSPYDAPPDARSERSLFREDSYNRMIDTGSYRSDGYKADKLGNILKGLLTNKDALFQDGAIAIDPVLLGKIMRDAQYKDALAVSIGEPDAAEMRIAGLLANIMKNPTDEQKIVLDVIKALLSDTSKMQQEEADKAKPEELKKAENDLLNAVANILLAQAMPDLLRKGDMANVKDLFSELDKAKKQMFLEYAKSTRPYYDNVLKDLAKNMAMLQAKNLLNPDMTKEELSKLPPSELDKILDRIKKEEKKAFEEEYILQQEAKYRKEYIDPNKKKLEDSVKGMLKSFAGRINDVLKSAEKK